MTIEYQNKLLEENSRKKLISNFVNFFSFSEIILNKEVFLLILEIFISLINIKNVNKFVLKFLLKGNFLGKILQSCDLFINFNNFLLLINNSFLLKNQEILNKNSDFIFGNLSKLYELDDYENLSISIGNSNTNTNSDNNSNFIENDNENYNNNNNILLMKYLLNKFNENFKCLLILKINLISQISINFIIEKFDENISEIIFLKFEIYLKLLYLSNNNNNINFNKNKNKNKLKDKNKSDKNDDKYSILNIDIEEYNKTISRFKLEILFSTSNLLSDICNKKIEAFTFSAIFPININSFRNLFNHIFNIYPYSNKMINENLLFLCIATEKINDYLINLFFDFNVFEDLISLMNINKKEEFYTIVILFLNVFYNKINLCKYKFYNFLMILIEKELLLLLTNVVNADLIDDKLYLRIIELENLLKENADKYSNNFINQEK
jgi:hypothetical protein